MSEKLTSTKAMPLGSKKKYTSKQKRRAEKTVRGYKKRGVGLPLPTELPPTTEYWLRLSSA
jgi:hypothetical protein